MALEVLARSGPTIFVKHGSLPDELQTRIRHYNPKTDLGALVKAALAYLPREFAAELLDTIQRSVVIQSQLEVRVFRALDGRPWPRDPRRGLLHPVSVEEMARRDPIWRTLFEDCGVTSKKLVTNAGIDYLIADMAGGAGDISSMKYHGLGTATTAEAATQTALTTELTTQYNPDSTRATGTNTANTGPTPDTITCSGTNTLDANATVEEHGLFSAASAGTLHDRSLTGTQTLSASDSLQTNYTWSPASGG